MTWIKVNGKGVRVTKKEKDKIKHTTVIKKLIYHCGKLDKEMTVDITEHDFESWDSPCDLCEYLETKI